MRTISILKYTFTVVGFGMLVGALFLFTDTRDFLQNAQTANGMVVDLVRSSSSDSDTYRPVLEFTTRDGSVIEFTSSTGTNPPSFSEGEIVGIFYQESSPEQAKIDSFFSLWGAPIILGSLGSVFFLIGMSILLFGRLKGKKIEYLRQNGIPIKAKIQSVDVNGSLEVNGRNPYQIRAHWKNPSTSELHIFHSENIWFNPTAHIKTDEVTVLIERDNPKKYYVDISFLPNGAS